MNVEIWDCGRTIPFLGVFVSNFQYCVFAMRTVIACHLLSFPCTGQHPKTPTAQLLLPGSYVEPREYLMVYRRPLTELSCGRMIRLLAQPPPPSPVTNLSLFISLPVCRRSSLLTGEAGRGGGLGAKAYDRKKAWTSIKHSTRSEGTCLPSPLLYAPLFYVFLPTLKHLFWCYIRSHKLCKYWL